VLGGFFLVARFNKIAAGLWLALASLFFYGWWSPQFILLLLSSICFNYCAGYVLSRGQAKTNKLLLGLAISVNLVCLGFFKYVNFFISTIDSLGADIGLLDIVLPIGISFYTFTQIAFLVDAYRGVAREYNFVHYLLFVTWFPHLIAGPVLHHSQMMPQFASPQTFKPNPESLSVGLTFFAIGLFKKVVLADYLAIYANPLFNLSGPDSSPMLISAWAGSLAYTLQLYFDFSGYSDMAIGLSRMFNIKLPLNFDSPYKAVNIIEFWRRWHMTLSHFLRDYLYFPLGGNRKGPTRRQINLMATMLLGGLWHGAGWTFVLWGALHGLYLVINHAWQNLSGRLNTKNSRLKEYFSVGLTFILVVFAWVPFRAPDISTTLEIWKGMIGLNGITLHPSLLGYMPESLASGVIYNGFVPELQVNTVSLFQWIALGLFIVWVMPNTQQILSNYAPAWDKARPGKYLINWRPTKIFGFITGLVFAVAVLLFQKNSPFLYFQF
jgi:D-alanyl-lipoteichoic acid acyltransferase DltB (MBOAT superfamily)